MNKARSHRDPQRGGSKGSGRGASKHAKRGRGKATEPSEPDARGLAATLLTTLERELHRHASAAVADLTVQHGLVKRERKFLHELVLGVMRRRGTLDAILRAYCKKPLESLDASVRQALRIGLYQLLYMDGIPPFAAVSTAVEHAGRHQGVRSFANAVLRSIERECRRVPLSADRGGASPRKRLYVHDQKVCFFSRAVFADPEVDEAEYLADLTGHPSWVTRRWLDRLGREEAEALLHRNNRRAPLFVRVRPGTRDEVLERYRKESIDCAEGALDDSIIVTSPATELVRTKAFRAGVGTVQDETAMRVGVALAEKQPATVLDLCAAPGGKATQLAERLPEAQIIASDRDETRVERLQENIERLGLQERVQVRVFDPLEPGDDTMKPVDAVLLDVPCTNSGVLRRRPEARQRLSENALTALTARQAELLVASVAWVKEGGWLAYSTCSVEPEENGQQVRAFMEAHPAFQLDREEEHLPQDHGGDGGYFALMRRQTAG